MKRTNNPFIHTFQPLDKFNPVKVINLERGVGLVNMGTLFDPDYLTVPIKFQSVRISGDESHGPVSYIIDKPLTRKGQIGIIGDHGADGNITWRKVRTGQKFIHTDHPVKLVSQHIGKKNILMALIDISAIGDADEILKPLRKEIISYRKKLPAMLRSPKTSQKNENKLIGQSSIWKSYLIVYDLVKNGLTYEEASGILSDYDDDKLSNYGTAKKIERHYNSAVSMINGGYKKYLSEHSMKTK